MSNLISEPLDVMTNKEMHQLYEHKGIDPKNNMLDVTQKDMELCHKHWPDNFETLYDIGAKAFETFLVDRHHLVKLFKVDQVKSETWRQHFVLDRCVLHMLQMLHETISVYHEDMSEGNKIDEEFFKKIQTFGGRYRCLAPMVPVKEYFHLFNVWTEMHMDFIVLTCFEGPVCNKEKAIISGVWEKIIQNIKVHFVYGWHHKLYNMTGEEKEYFMKEKTSEPTRSRLITKLTRLMSRESFSDTSSEDKTSPTRKTSQNQPSLSGLGSSRSRDTPSGRSNHLTIATSSREADIIRSEPIEICDISLNLLNSPADCSPINISNHF